MALPPIAITPFGCRHCGIPEQAHCQRWKPPAGWHSHVAPTDSQILARMKARRAARTTTIPKGTPMSTPPKRTTIDALHTLLIEHPELVALPIRWSVNANGELFVNPKYCAPGSHEAVRVLGAALGIAPYEMAITTEEGQVVKSVSVYGDFAAAKVYSTGYELAPVAVSANGRAS